MMTEFFTSPRLADLILIVLFLEGVGLIAWRASTGQGPALRATLPFLLSGAFLALALRAVLAGADWPWIALPLLGALFAHLRDLHQRWISRPSDPGTPGTAR